MSKNDNIAESLPNNRKLKKLYKSICKQMEFYFSDSNLVRDKFLFDLISMDPDGFVKINVFKKFNKIRALTNSSEVIVTSVSRSDKFEISSDHKKIRRATPVDLSKDFDSCTLYVEKLPPNADTKWVKDVLSQFGPIAYVNVPHFKLSNKIKGFAFVEFESPEGVENACEFYKNSQGKECTSEDESKSMKNAKKHKHEEPSSDKKNKKGRTRTVSDSSDKIAESSSSKNDQQVEATDKASEHDQDGCHQKNKKKRKRGNSESETAVKKSKEWADEDPVPSESRSSHEVKTEASDVKIEEPLIQTKEEITTNEDKIEVSNNVLNGSKTEEVKTKRKRKSSKKSRPNTDKAALRVMPKTEWKAYRNKYLDLQRATMSLLKKQILYETQQLKEQESNSKTTDATESKKSNQYVPGVIIKVKLTEPVKNEVEIKTQVKASAVVAYVDAALEQSEIYIRCHNSEDAQTIVKEEKLGFIGKAEIIEGDAEQKYWEKIEAHRKIKYSNPVKHNKRGRDKLIAKAAKLEEMKNKHIYFED